MSGDNIERTRTEPGAVTMDMLAALPRIVAEMPADLVEPAERAILAVAQYLEAVRQYRAQHSTQA